MFYRIIDCNGRPHEVEYDAAELPERLEAKLQELRGHVVIVADTEEQFEKRKQQDVTGKADTY